jgi:cell surface protein SprA
VLTWFAVTKSTGKRELSQEIISLEKEFAPPDTGKSKIKPKKTKKTTKPDFEPKDRYGDPYSNPEIRTPLILKNPVTTEVELDSSGKFYTIHEKVNGVEFRPPTTMTFEEYQQYRNRESLRQYWASKRSDPFKASTDTSKKKSAIFKLPVRKMNGPFGGDFVEIRPSGLVTLDFAGKWQRVNNPNIPIRQQRNGNFDFDQQISMNVVGQLGQKLKITSNWDTKATFDFQNNIKLEFTGFQEDIIQKIEAGTVSMPLNSTLISGAQNLFGVKTKLQFGRLTATGIMASQRGKVEEMVIQGGAQSRDFEVKMDNYDLYRHFFLGHFFRQNYERSLRSLPLINSGVKITRLEVYITNRTNNTTTLRNMIAYLDLGEAEIDQTNQAKNPASLKHPFNPKTTDSTANGINQVFDKVYNFRDPNLVGNQLDGIGFARGTDYEIIDHARKLTVNEYTFNPDLGYISLTTPLRPDEVMAVAFEYTLNGVTHKVGELNGDYNNRSGKDIIILKMIKPSTIKTRLSTWDLMMKNIYQVAPTQLTRDNFQLRVIYKNDLTGADLPNLQEGTNTTNVPIIRLLGLDRLNPNNDPPGDGNFDYIEGVTVDSRNGRIIFPVLEPLGQSLDTYFIKATEDNLRRKYIFSELYDSTQSDAIQIASKNKYFLKGKYQGSNSNEIALQGINIAPGSVTVLAGSTPLVENTDYTIDYNMGKVKILNQGVLESGKEIRIRFEKQDLFNFRRKSFMGTRLEYKVSRDLLLGATVLHQREAPQITRVNIGDEPSRNTIWGLDATYQRESRFITRMVDKLPMIQTKAPSSINFNGEFAQLLPGHAKVISKGTDGTSFIDDFEGAETPYDFTRLPTKWRLGGTPKRFPESDSGGVAYAYRRAKLAWYSIDPVFYRQSGDGKPKSITDSITDNHYNRVVGQQEVFPNRDQQVVTTNEPTLDLAYFPAERGPYNFNPDLDQHGHIPNPDQNWGAMTREIRNDIDFDNANIQYIEFWMMDPYLQGINSSDRRLNTLPLSTNTALNKPISLSNTGQLFFNLGSISEDVMKNNHHDFENGLPLGDTAGNVTQTAWGVSTLHQFITNAFDNTPGARDKQDAGLDGLKDPDERNYFKSYLNTLLAKGTITTAAYDSLIQDVAADNFQYFLGDEADGGDYSILQRYKNFNGQENNSPIHSEGPYTPSSSSYPDNEDLNSDNTINNIEEYYEYKVSIDPAQLVVGQNNIVSSETSSINGDNVTWYQFRIPIRLPDSVVGNISGYKSIRFLRAYMTGFSDPIVLRMAQFQLVSNQWRVYQQDDINESTLKVGPEPFPANIVVSTINIEENGQGTANSAPYVLPPGFSRDRDIGAQNNRRLNEQSLKLCVDNLAEGDARGVYKNVNLDLLNYGKVRMFLHAENDFGYADGAVHAFLRIGTDYNQNYYEIEVPLHFTNPKNSTDELQIWRIENEIEVSVKDLTAVKISRDNAGFDKSKDFIQTIHGRIIRVRGVPDMSAVQGVMIGVRNPLDADKTPKSLCIWANELRMTDFIENAGEATASKLNIKLADLGTVNASMKYTSPGFGSLDQRVSQRSRNFTTQWGVSSNLALDKFLPAALGIKLPMYISYDQSNIAPKYNPLNPDVLLKTTLSNIPDPEQKKLYRSFTVDETKRRSINFTNVQKVKTKKDAKPHIYDVENLTLNASYSETERHNINLKNYNQQFYKAGLGYTYNANPKNFEPFKKAAWLKSPYLRLIKDINFTLLPSSITFRTDLDRKFTRTEYFEGNPLTEGSQAPLFEKSFTFNRSYGMIWNFTKNISVDYSAVSSGVIDEPSWDPEDNKKAYKDSIVSNLEKLGRVKNYNQTIGANYKLPLDKLPFTDWISADTRYSGGYTWTSGALGIRDTLGNAIQNTRDITVTSKVNLEKLYNKVKFLKNINSPPPPVKGPQVKKDTVQKLPKPKLRGLKAVMKGLMSVKSVNINYGLKQGLGMAGYLPKVNYFGTDRHMDNFGTILPFILGSQDADFRFRAASKNYISESRSLNTPFQRMKNVEFRASTTLEPIKDMKIQVDAQRNTASQYKELFRHAIDPGIDDFVSESPVRTGTYSMSYIAIGSMFRGKPNKKGGSDGDPHASSAFNDFSAYREIIRSRLDSSQNYSLNSQDVLIPAFLAAYAHKDPAKQRLGAFLNIPLPNWRIDFAGLTRIKKIAKIFPSFNITHSYSCIYNISNYTSSLEYNSSSIQANQDPSQAPQAFLKNKDGEYIPLYIIDQVSIIEKFAPFLGVNFRTKGKLTGRLEYKRDRELRMNLANAQLEERLNNGLVVGIGLTKSNVKIPFTGPQHVVLKNELQFRVDLTINDTKTILRKFDGISTITAGNLNFQLKPTLNYMINQRVTLQFYFDRQINAPRISSSFRRATTAFGLQVRFTLS